MIFDDVKVGDRFRDKQKGIILTVMELTSKGFKYDCTPYHCYPARYGPSEVTSGELYYKEHDYINWSNHYEEYEREINYEI